MIEAGEKTLRYAQGVSNLQAFRSNEVAVDAVVRNVQIFGEAVRQIPGEVQARYSDVDWAGMRNILVHRYGTVRLDVVWNVVQADIPVTSPRLREILERELPEGPSPPG
jgi:uncharacterized protein with HEPN domain